jgi:hypothetical protein
MLLIALLALTFGFREPICLVGCCGDPDAQSELAGQSEAPMPCHGDSPVEQAPTPGPEQAMECSGDAVALPSLAPSNPARWPCFVFVPPGAQTATTAPHPYRAAGSTSRPPHSIGCSSNHRS